MSNPAQSIIGRVNEIGANTTVRLGVVCTVALALLGGVMWLNSMHEKITIMEHRIETLRANQEKDKDALEKRLDRIESKLDRVLEKKP